MLELYRQLRKRHALRTPSVEQARRAHEEGHDHLLHVSSTGIYVGDFVFGAIDGVVTTFAITAGVAGAHLSGSVVIVLGLASLLADGFAMGIGNFLSIKSDHQRYDSEKKREAWEIKHLPEHEREEVAEIFRQKGFEGRALESAVKTITDNKEKWLETMMQDELGLIEEDRSPIIGGLVTYLSFVIIGFIPLISYILGSGLGEATFWLSVLFTAVALFLIGPLKTLIVVQKWWMAGLETLIMGGLAAAVAYAVGYLLSSIIV